MSPFRVSDRTNGRVPYSVQDAQGQQPQPIAVIGYSMRLPQDVTTSDALWDLMMNKRNTATAFPKTRINVDSMYHPDGNRRGQIPVRQSHFLKQDIASFDAAFFATSTSDAAIMDPQQRLLLECTYTALENAGISMERASGSRTSVYAGSFCTDWTHLAYKDGEQCPTTTGLGISASVLSNRVSWFFNLCGNSISVDTACSSSLVCLDMGCKGLISGSEDMSIVAGSNVIISPDTLHSLTNLNMLSPDGQSYSFDSRGNGYGRGEGVVVLVLKRVADAIRDHDNIRGIIRNTGCNHCGRTTSISLPSRIAQEKLINDCYEKAGLSMEPTRFFEAHGTGTQVGDPIESRAIGSAFRNVRTSQDPLWVGAMKSNIGHLEGGSGLAGIIKTLLVLEKAIIPPNANFEKPNPNIDSEFLRIKFPLHPVPWPTRGLRRASVNSFGNSGTNAHAILDDVYHFLEEHGLQATHLTVEDPPSVAVSEPAVIRTSTRKRKRCDTDNEKQQRSLKLLPLSANDAEGIRRVAADISSHHRRTGLSRDLPPDYLDDLAYTLSEKRTSLSWKSYAIVQTIQDLEKLDTLISPAHKALSNPKLGFVFTGQGAQWPRMAYELMSYPIFRKSLLASEECLMKMGCTWRLREEMFKEQDSGISSPELSQPICTAVQVALLDLLESFSIQPTAVIGHSSGEIAAAYCTRAISHTSAIRIAYHRGLLAGSLAKSHGIRGAMMAVGISQNDILPYLQQVTSVRGKNDLVIACVNSPKNVTISGSEDSVESLRVILERSHIFARKLRVDVAYHSPQMRKIADAYLTKIKDIQQDLRPKPAIAMFSSVTGKRSSIDQTQSPEYWVSNLVSPVKFYDALRGLLTGSAQKVRKKLDLSHRDKFQIDMLVEIGPHSTLQAPISDTIAEFHEASRIGYTSLLSRNNAADVSMIQALGQIQSAGYAVDMVPVNKLSSNPGTYTTLSDLPEYRFDHSRQYWTETRLSRRYRTSQQGKLDLLGKPVLDWNTLEPRWRHFLRLSEMPWMEDHVINGACIYPGAGMIVMAIEAANQLSAREEGVLGFELENVSFLKSLTIPHESGGIETQIAVYVVRDDSRTLASWSKWRLFVYEHENWVECCTGMIRVKYQNEGNGVNDSRHEEKDYEDKRILYEDLHQSCQSRLDIPLFYRNLNESGLGLQSSFQRLQSGRFGDLNQGTFAIKPFEWPENQFPQDHVVHPTTLDCIFHSGLAGHSRGGNKAVPTLVPTHLHSLFVSKTGLSYSSTNTIAAAAWLTPQGKHANLTGFALDMSDGKVLVDYKDLQSTNIAENSQDGLADSLDTLQSAYQIESFPDPSLISPEGILTFCQQQIQAAGSCLSSYIDLLASKASGLRVLAVEDTGNFISTSTLEVLDIQNDHSNKEQNKIRLLSVLSPSDDAQEDDSNSPKNQSYMQYHNAEIEQSLLEQGFEPDFYDVVTAGKSLAYNSAALKHLQQVMKPSGKLMLFETRGHAPTGKILTNGNGPPAPLLEAGFTYPAFTFPSVEQDDGAILTAHVHGLNRKLGSGTPDHNVYIIIDPESDLQHSDGSSLAAFLSSQGIAHTRIVSLQEASGLDTSCDSTFVMVIELYRPLLYAMHSNDYSALQLLLISTKNIVWINAAGGSGIGRPEYTLVNGLARALRNEYEDLRFTTVSFEDSELSHNRMSSLVKIIDRRHIRPSPEVEDVEYFEIDGIMNISRIQVADTLTNELNRRAAPYLQDESLVKNVPPLMLTIDSPGMLDTLQFTEDTLPSQPLEPDEIEVQVAAIGVNFKDCLIALGRLEGPKMGQECVGSVIRAGSDTDFKKGERVVITHGDLFKTVARAKAYAAFRLPESLSSEIAATITIQFGTAWAAIKRLARMEQGESILIHSGTSGTGQAAIQLAKMLGADIYTTVGSQEKKRLLMDYYHIPEDHIFYSRNNDFAKGIKQATNGRGVDVIINSLADDLLLATWDCIASHGRFIEIGKKNITTNSNLPMLAFEKNASFHGLDAAYFFHEKRAQGRSDIEQLIQMFANKRLHPAQPMQTRDIGEVREVFKTIQTGNKPGKIVLMITPDSSVPTSLRPKPSFRISDAVSYVISGGFGGIGRATARFLADRGARNLIFLSRNGPRTESARKLLDELRKDGVRVYTPACDITDLTKIQEVFDNLKNEIPPIKGCVQGALVGRDSIFNQMTFEDWRISVDCKTIGSWNLHTVLPKGMDFFIMLSSGSGLVGVKGQANYDAGNTYEDALARHRVSHGEKATTFDLGAMIDDGILAEDPGLLNRVLAYGSLEPVTRQKYFAMLDYFCDPSLPLLTPTQSQVAVGIGTGGGDGLEKFDYSRQPMLHPLERIHERQSASSRSNEPDSKALLAASTSLDDAAKIVAQTINKKLAKSLANLRDTAADMDKPLQLQGVDSLLAIELRNWIVKEFKADIAVFETQGASTLGTLSMLVAIRSTVRHPGWSNFGAD